MLDNSVQLQMSSLQADTIGMPPLYTERKKLNYRKIILTYLLTYLDLVPPVPVGILGTSLTPERTIHLM